MDTQEHGKLRFCRTDSLSIGKFGSTFRGTFERTIDVAIKRILLKEYIVDLEVLRQAQNHSNILRYYCSEQDIEYMFIATELTSGTLKDIIRGHYQGPVVGDLRKMLKQVTMGLAFLHEKKIAHRELKPSNIFISSPSSSTESPVLKLGNFGMNHNVKKSPFFLWKLAGSKCWMAPEAYELTEFTITMDLYSLGLIYGFSLSGGKHPFGCFCKEERILRIRKKMPMTLTHEDLKHLGESYAASVLPLISSLLSVNPNERPSASVVLQHSSLQKSAQINEVEPTRKIKLEYISKDEAALSPLTKKIKSESVDVVSGLKPREEPLYEASSSDTAIPRASRPHNSFVAAQNGKSVDNLRESNRIKRKISPKEIQLIELCSRKSLDDISFKHFVKLVKDRDVNINRSKEDGLTPLLLLTWKNQSEHLVECLEALLQREDLDLNAKDSIEGWNALWNVCRYYNRENLIQIIRLLLDREIEVPSNDVVLIMACANFKHESLISIVRLLLHYGVDVNAVSKPKRWNVLFSLCYNYTGDNLIAIIRILIEEGVEVNLKTNYGWNSLLAMAELQNTHKDFVEIVKLLIHHKIDVNAMDNQGINTLIVLCERYGGPNFTEIVSLLISKGCQVDAITNLGWNALFALCYSNSSPELIHVARLLLEAGINVNMTIGDGWNCLLALSSQQANHPDLLDIIELLIQHGVDVSAKDKKRQNSLIFLCANFNYKGDNLVDIIQLLVKHGLNINQKNSDEKNVLHLLCESYGGQDLPEVVECLCEKTVINGQALDKARKKPLDYLIPRIDIGNKAKIVQLLSI